MDLRQQQQQPSAAAGTVRRVQKATEPLTFESLMDRMGLLGQSSTSADGPHPITSVSDETITLHYSLEGDESSTVALFDDHIIYPDHEGATKDPSKT